MSKKEKAFVALVAVTLAAGLYWNWKQTTVISEQLRKIDGLTSKMSSRPDINRVEIDLQEQCAKQAREQYNQSEWSKEPDAGFTNHYNQTLNKCFMLIGNTDAKIDPGTIWTNVTLVDAFEGKVLGSYHWHTEKGKKYWEVPPFQCEVTLPSGEKVFCKSQAEFDDLIKIYME